MIRRTFRRRGTPLTRWARVCPKAAVIVRSCGGEAAEAERAGDLAAAAWEREICRLTRWMRASICWAERACGFGEDREKEWAGKKAIEGGRRGEGVPREQKRPHRPSPPQVRAIPTVVVCHWEVCYRACARRSQCPAPRPGGSEDARARRTAPRPQSGGAPAPEFCTWLPLIDANH